MMNPVNIHEAKTKLSRLLERGDGEEIGIARNGKPIVRLSRYIPPTLRGRQPGSLEGQIRISDDFDEPDAHRSGILRKTYPYDA